MNRLQARIQGRDLAKTLLTMAELPHQPQDVLDGFWNQIRTAMPNEKTNEPVITSIAMTEEEAIEYERSLIDFGQYTGHRFSDVPIKYLEWLADKSIKLRRYIQSSRAQRRTD